MRTICNWRRGTDGMTFKIDKFEGLGRPSPEIAEGSSVSCLPVRDLSTAEHFLLVAIRHWVKALKEQKNPMQILRRGFNLAKVDAAMEDFHAVMTITANSATTALDVRCPKCASYGDGEKSIISAVAFAQAEKSQWALQRLGAWLPGSEALAALAHIEKLARELTKSNLVVPLRLEYISRDLVNASDDAVPQIPSRDYQTMH